MDRTEIVINKTARDGHGSDGGFPEAQMAKSKAESGDRWIVENSREGPRSGRVYRLNGGLS